MIKWIVVVGVMAFAPLPAFGAQLTADSINAANFTGKVPSEERYQTSLPAGGPQSTARGGWRHESGPLPGRYGESVTIRSLAHSDGGNSVTCREAQLRSTMSSSSGSTPISRR